MACRGTAASKNYFSFWLQHPGFQRSLIFPRYVGNNCSRYKTKMSVLDTLAPGCYIMLNDIKYQRIGSSLFHNVCSHLLKHKFLFFGQWFETSNQWRIHFFINFSEKWLLTPVQRFNYQTYEQTSFYSSSFSPWFETTDWNSVSSLLCMRLSIRSNIVAYLGNSIFRKKWN